MAGPDPRFSSSFEKLGSLYDTARIYFSDPNALTSFARPPDSEPDPNQYLDSAISLLSDSTQYLYNDRRYLDSRLDAYDKKADKVEAKVNRYGDKQGSHFQYVQKQVERVEDNIKVLKNNVKTVKDDIKSFREDVNRQFEEVKGDIQEVKGDINTVKIDVKTVTYDIKVFKADVNRQFKEVRNDIKAVRNDVEIVKEDISRVKNDIKSFKEDVNRQFKEVKDDMAVVKDDMAVVKDDMAVVKDDMAVVKDDMAVVKDDMARSRNRLATRLVSSIHKISAPVRDDNGQLKNEVAPDFPITVRRFWRLRSDIPTLQRLAAHYITDGWQEWGYDDAEDSEATEFAYLAPAVSAHPELCLRALAEVWGLEYRQLERPVGDRSWAMRQKRKADSDTESREVKVRKVGRSDTEISVLPYKNREEGAIIRRRTTISEPDVQVHTEMSLAEVLREYRVPGHMQISEESAELRWESASMRAAKHEVRAMQGLGPPSFDSGVRRMITPEPLNDRGDQRRTILRAQHLTQEQLYANAEVIPFAAEGPMNLSSSQTASQIQLAVFSNISSTLTFPLSGVAGKSSQRSFNSIRAENRYIDFNYPLPRPRQVLPPGSTVRIAFRFVD